MTFHLEYVQLQAIKKTSNWWFKWHLSFINSRMIQWPTMLMSSFSSSPTQSYSACWLFILEHLLLQLQNDYHTSRYHVLYPTLPKAERVQKSVVQSPVPLLFSRKNNFPCKHPTDICLSHWSDQGHILLD